MANFANYGKVKMQERVLNHIFLSVGIKGLVENQKSFSSLSKKHDMYLTPPISGPPRLLPIASISSMKIMEGANDLALEKRSFTRDAATPTNIWQEKFR